MGRALNEPEGIGPYPYAVGIYVQTVHDVYIHAYSSIVYLRMHELCIGSYSLLWRQSVGNCYLQIG